MTSALWDPWGLFFIHLTHESGISDYKGMNSGWMNLGWNFLHLFLSIKKDDIQFVFFHKIKDGNFITLWNEFQGVFFICFMRCKFLTKNRWDYGIFFICLWECEFLAKNGWILWYFFHPFMGHEFLTKNRWTLLYVFHLFMVHVESMVTCNKCDTPSQKVWQISYFCDKNVVNQF